MYVLIKKGRQNIARKIPIEMIITEYNRLSSVFDGVKGKGIP